MQSLKIGHYTSLEHNTGVSVFLFDHPVAGAYQICGSSPATRELSILDLEANNIGINGLVLTGGSAFGLGAVDGVMQFLCEQNKGKHMPHGGVVPIVPAAAIYDLAVKSAVSPTKEHGYQACQEARVNNVQQGRIGAGAGASVGKLIPGSFRMSGGLGCAQKELADGLVVRAYAVVNAVGDIQNTHGEIVAGARLSNGEYGDCKKFLLEGGIEAALPPQSNTTLIAIFTNGAFSSIELKRIIKMAIAGMAQVISPAFTRYDGDIIFGVSLGECAASELTVGVLAVDVIQQAIVNAVSHSLVIDKME